MKLPITTEVFSASEDQSWLGSAHGTNEAESITLDVDAFLGTWADGIIPSGIVVASDGAGLFVPATDASAEAPFYHLFTTLDVGTEAGAQVSGAGLWHGQVIVANLPENHGLDTDTAVPQVNYVGTVPTPEV